MRISVELTLEEVKLAARKMYAEELHQDLEDVVINVVRYEKSKSVKVSKSDVRFNHKSDRLDYKPYLNKIKDFLDSPDESISVREADSPVSTVYDHYRNTITKYGLTGSVKVSKLYSGTANYGVYLMKG